MNLETMGRRRRLPVIAHGDGKEMILDVGIFDTGAGTDEGTGFKMIGGAQTFLPEEPFDADHSLGEQIELRIERNRQEAFVLEIDFEMVVEILADARQM